MPLPTPAAERALPDSHYFISFSRGERMRTVCIRPAVLLGLTAILPVLCLSAIGICAATLMRDDMLASVMTRQTQMQYAYEDRLATLRTQLDRVTSRQLLDQDSVEGKVHQLLSRQAQLESRGSVVASLSQQVGLAAEVTGSTSRNKTGGKPDVKVRAASPNPLLNGFGAITMPQGVTSFAGESPIPQKPRPEALEPAPARAEAEKRAGLADDPDLPLPLRLRRIAISLDRVETDQIRTLGAIEQKARGTAETLSKAMLEAGLAPARLSAPGGRQTGKLDGMGGPFVPLKVDAAGSVFERELGRMQTSIAAADRLGRVLPYVPLRAPLPSEAEVTSAFGARVDPFMRRAALHTGVDLRLAYGAPIRATAGGTVTAAGSSGGYGNMVEIDHGNGIETRYAHMSSIAVSEGDRIEAGAVVGRIGSTGRSTGPHLHYEVRTLHCSAWTPALAMAALRALGPMGLARRPRAHLAAPRWRALPGLAGASRAAENFSIVTPPDSVESCAEGAPPCASLARGAHCGGGDGPAHGWGRGGLAPLAPPPRRSRLRQPWALAWRQPPTWRGGGPSARGGAPSVGGGLACSGVGRAGGAPRAWTGPAAAWGSAVAGALAGDCRCGWGACRRPGVCPWLAMAAGRPGARQGWCEA